MLYGANPYKLFLETTTYTRPRGWCEGRASHDAFLHFFLITMRVSKDKPIAELTVRKYPRPEGLDRRELIKRLCLSLGLLQPGDSRDVVVDVLQSIIDAKNPMMVDQIIEDVQKRRKQHKLQLIGVAPSNIRRQIKRCRDLFLIEKINNAYQMTENMTLEEIFTEKIQQYYLRSILDRVKEYCHELSSRNAR